MVSMICLWSVPLRELAMVTEEPMELASKRAQGELLHWLWVVPNASGSEIQQGRLQMVLGGWVGGHGGRRGLCRLWSAWVTLRRKQWWHGRWAQGGIWKLGGQRGGGIDKP